MKAWTSIQQTLDYIEANLSKDLKLQDLADQGNLSLFYFQKLFKRLVNKSVMEYVKLRRLAVAGEQLRLEGGKILDIALDLGFNNHETFTRAFKETYGMTPSEYRGNPVFLSHCIVPDLSLNYRLVDLGTPLIADGVVLEINKIHLEKERLFTGYSVQNEMGNETGIDQLGELWKALHHEKNMPYVTRETVEIGISSQGEKEGCFTYFAGTEVLKHTDEWLISSSSLGKKENRRLTTGQYLVCSFSAENFHYLTSNALDKVVQYMFSTWLPNHPNIQVEPYMVEVYDEKCLGVEEGPEMAIWMKIKSNQ